MPVTCALLAKYSKLAKITKAKEVFVCFVSS